MSAVAMQQVGPSSLRRRFGQGAGTVGRGKQTGGREEAKGQGRTIMRGGKVSEKI